MEEQKHTKVYVNQLLARIKCLENALRWYVDNDDTNEGGHWEKDNAFWLKGKRRAEKLLNNKLSKT